MQYLLLWRIHLHSRTFYTQIDIVSSLVHLSTIGAQSVMSQAPPPKRKYLLPKPAWMYAGNTVYMEVESCHVYCHCYMFEVVSNKYIHHTPSSGGGWWFDCAHCAKSTKFGTEAHWTNKIDLIRRCHQQDTYLTPPAASFFRNSRNL